MITIQKAEYLVTMELEYEDNTLSNIIKLWDNSYLKDRLSSYSLYHSLTENKLVLLYTVKKFQEIQQIIESSEYDSFIREAAGYIASDIKQAAYGLVDIVLPRNHYVPSTKYMQLRTIEVPLSGIDSYLDWRKKRIYAFVNKNDKVGSFLAFHSVFASTPGVLFVAEFSGDITTYRNSFLTPEYQEIIKEAGHDHIKGGLSTLEYELVSTNIKGEDK